MHNKANALGLSKAASLRYVPFDIRLFSALCALTWKSRMPENWEDIEKLVHLIEKSINPDSEVLHDQNLPVLNSPTGRTRQCDVVIISGNKKRRTTTIVEVQNRTSRVDINTFNGWLEKLKEVGAQHLVCVSKLAFPSSVKEKASQIGPTVILVNLTELTEPDSIPLQLINSRTTFSDFDIQELSDVEVTYSKAHLDSTEITSDDLDICPFGINDEIFSLDGKNTITIFKISQNALQQNKFNAPEVSEILIEEPENIYVLIKGTFLKLKKLCYKVKWSYQLYKIPPTVMTYEQVDDGTLAWVLEFNFYNDKRSMSIKLPFTGEAERLELNNMQAEASHDMNIFLVKHTNGT